MVENNAREIKLQLETALATQSDQLSALRDVGPMLLDMLLGERAIMLNRAAASDKSLRLGKIIAECGRNQIFPLVDDLVASAMEQEVVSFSSSESGATLYMNLLIGDLQIRRVIGVLDKPTNGRSRSGPVMPLKPFCFWETKHQYPEQEADYLLRKESIRSIARSMFSCEFA